MAFPLALLAAYKFISLALPHLRQLNSFKIDKINLQRLLENAATLTTTTTTKAILRSSDKRKKVKRVEWIKGLCAV